MPREKSPTVTWSERASQRLRWVQASCGDLPPAERADHLSIELENLAAELPTATRKEGLRELLTLFPGLEKETTYSPEPAAAFGDAFIAAPQQPEDLARELAHRWPQLTAEQRATCEAHLHEAGIAATAPASHFGELEGMLTLHRENEGSAVLKLEMTRDRLELDDSGHPRPIDLGHLLALLYELIDHLADLEETLPTAWKTWDALHRGSSRIQPLPGGATRLTSALKDSLTGKDQRALSILLRNQSGAARLFAVITAALSHGGGFFARQFAKRFSSEQIAQELRSTKPRPTAEDCWLRFVQMSNEMTPNEVEYNLQRAIVRSVEELYHARGTR